MNYKNIALGIVIAALLVGIAFFLFGKSKLTPPPKQIEVPDITVIKKDKLVEDMSIEDELKKMEENQDDENTNTADSNETNDGNSDSTIESAETFQEEKDRELEEKIYEQEIKELKAAKEEERRSAALQLEMDVLTAQLKAAEDAMMIAESEMDPTAPIVDVAEIKDKIRIKKDELEYPPLVNP